MQQAQQVQAFLATRPRTNLLTQQQFALDKQQMKQGFMGVFTWSYSGDPRKTLIKLALSPFASTAAISVGKRAAAKTQEQRQARKAEGSKLRAWEKAREQLHLERFTKIQKVGGDEPHFLLHLPVVSMHDAADVDGMFSMFSGAFLSDDVLQEVRQKMDNTGTFTFPTNLALQRAKLQPEASALFASCLTRIDVAAAQGLSIVYLVFKVSQAEAQALVSEDWMEIRPVDLYPLFSMWVEAEFVSKLHSKSITSLSKIAKTLPTHDPVDERIDQYGIAIDMDGDPLWIPQRVDDTQKYESMLAAASVTTDGFAMQTVEQRSPPALPVNIPILVDWVNNKFTYSNSAGKPVIKPLEHLRKCNAAMAMNILKRPVPLQLDNRFAHYANVCKVSTLAADYGFSGDLPITKVWQSLVNEEFRFIDLTDDDPKPQAEPVRRFLIALYDGIMSNLDAMYAEYAVSTVTEAVGLLSVIVKYGTGTASTRAAASTIQEKALRQGVDPNWTPPAAPLVTTKFGTPEGGLLPHQAKSRNLLRESPDFAILSVDAGGGKSMLSITDILYEVKENRSAPYIIMCPSHLVANYVSELVEFTDGQVNVIPVTSFNVRTSGVARYEAILKTAPINSILVVDYDALKFRARAVGYGTSHIAVFPVIEMIRRFRPGYVMLDEAHFLRNAKSARVRAVLGLIADIPKKRLASGTLNPDSPSDLPGLVALLDPTIFGSREAFNERFGKEVRGNRVMQWNKTGPNAISQVMPLLKQHVVWVQAKRKEWACALPKRQDFFVSVELTEAQRTMYNAIFEEMVQQIQKAAQTDKNAKKLLERLGGAKATAEDEDDFGDMDEVSEEEDILDDSDDVGPSLQPYLADIERFVTDPAAHPYSQNGIVLPSGERVEPLTGDDLMAPKALALKQIIEKHLSASKSKVLIFVNYYASAESLFKAMPPELQAQGMLYEASSKTEMVHRFKTDPSVRWMIGIRKSLEVGLNLQQAGCLIRMEGVWTPGEQEQGDSRIARPYFGPGGDKREGLSFYTIVANRTIDVTKAARLRAKIVALAKFENTGNPAYEGIEDIPIIPMNLDTIQHQNDFETNLAQYQQSMAMLNEVIANENEEYRVQLEAEGGFKFTQIQKAPPPAGAAILSRVPYAQGTELYKASELGLIRVDNYLGMDLSDEDDEEEGDDDGVETSNIKLQRQRVIERRCHTEFGDGIIVGAAAIGGKDYVSRVHVRLDDGTTARGLRATNVFVITRTETNSIDMRNKLAQAAGLTITDEITVPGAALKQTKFSKKELAEMEREKARAERKARSLFKAIDVALQLQMVNGYMRLSYAGEDGRTIKALEALGFRMDQPYYYTRIRSYRHLIKQAHAWADAGFETSRQVDNETLQMLADELAKGGLQTHRHYQRMISNASFQNHLRTIWKPTADRTILNMFALITDGGAEDASVIRQAEKQGVDPSYAIAYLCLPSGAGHPGSKLAISSKYVAPGTRWYQSDQSLSMFVGSLRGAQHILRQIKGSGINITNLDELNKMAKSVKRVVPQTDALDLQDDAIPDDKEKPTKSTKPEKKVAPATKVKKAPVEAPKWPTRNKVVPETKKRRF